MSIQFPLRIHELDDELAESSSYHFFSVIHSHHHFCVYLRISPVDKTIMANLQLSTYSSAKLNQV
jgi:hypothetical protein